MNALLIPATKKKEMCLSKIKTWKCSVRKFAHDFVRLIGTHMLHSHFTGGKCGYHKAIFSFSKNSPMQDLHLKWCRGVFFLPVTKKCISSPPPNLNRIPKSNRLRHLTLLRFCTNAPDGSKFHAELTTKVSF